MSTIVILANLATLTIYTTLFYVGAVIADKIHFENPENHTTHKDLGFVKRVVLLHGFLFGAVFIAASDEWIFAHAYGSIAIAVSMGFMLGWLFECGLLYTFGISRELPRGG